jgi:histidinol-phosphate aminotransferase
MTFTRRGFLGTVGLGTAAGVLSGPSLAGRRAGAQTSTAAHSGVYDNGIMQLNQNESARGPGARTIEAIRSHVTRRLGRGYPPDHVSELSEALANYYSVAGESVQLATGSTPLLQGAVRAFCSAGKALVTAGPTYSTSEGTARQVGAPIKAVRVDDAGYLDLAGMAEAARGAGLIYVCNPNNPTGTVHGPQAVERFVRRVMQESPGTVIHIDEAYINYADPTLIQTAVPLTREFANVFVTRSFSKAHGLAGLRIGYAVGQAQTLASISNAWGMGDVNMLAAIAALTAMNDAEHLEWERSENARIRTFVLGAFRDMGFHAPDSQTNHVFVNLRRPAAEFREACLRHKILVGRDFPPMQNTHSRISLGTREEMEIAVDVFRRVLAA